VRARELAVRLAFIGLAAFSVACPNPNNCQQTPLPPNNIHLTLLDASTGQPTTTEAFVGAHSYGCTSRIDLLVTGTRDLTVSANGFVPTIVSVDGGEELRDCNMVWPTHDVSLTVMLAPAAIQDGGTCDGLNP
jgi:hypothetical protein